MSEEEYKIFFENCIKHNPCDFRQGIISDCRKMDKWDVYEWVAEDELKIQQLQQENQQLKEKINQYENPEDLTLFYMWLNEKAKDKMKELQQRIDKAIKYAHDRLGFLENCFGGNEIEIRACITIHNEYLKILTGEENENGL